MFGPANLRIPDCTLSRTSGLLGLSVIFFCTIQSAFGFWIHPENAGEAKVLVQSPRIRFLSTHVRYPVSGELVYSSDMKPSGNFTGKVLLYQLHSLQFAEDLCETMFDTGVEAIVTIFNVDNFFPGISQYSRARVNLPGNPFPVFEITWAQNKTLEDWFKNQTRGVFVSFDEDEENPWDYTYQKQIPILAFVILIASGITMVIGVYKLTLLISRDGLRVNIGQLVLFLNCFSCALRIVWTSVDPVGVYGIYPYWLVQLGMTIPSPFVIAGAILITLYWHEMIQKTGRKLNNFLDRMLLPFIVIGVVLFGFELATATARAVGATIRWLIVLDAIAYAVIILGLLVFFIITKIRLYRVFQKLNKRLNTKEKRLKIASNIVVATGAVMFLYLVTLIVLGIGTLFWTPKGFIALISAILSTMVILSFLQVMLIRAPQRPWKWIFCGLFVKDPAALLREDNSTKSRAQDTSSRKSSLSHRTPEADDL